MAYMNLSCSSYSYSFNFLLFSAHVALAEPLQNLSAPKPQTLQPLSPKPLNPSGFADACRAAGDHVRTVGADVQTLNSSFHFRFHYPNITPLYYSSFHIFSVIPFEPYIDALSCLHAGVLTGVSWAFELESVSP